MTNGNRERRTIKGLSTWRDWHDLGFFQDEGTAREALLMLQMYYLNGLSDMTQPEFLGLSETEFNDWMLHDRIPAPEGGYRGA